MAGKTGYSTVQIGLHWLVAVLILVNWFVAEGMEEVFDGSLEDPTVAGGWHVWIGLAVLALVVLRVVVRLVTGAPAAGGVAGTLAQRLAGLGHMVLYVLMIGVPLGGAIVWFGKVEALGDGHALAANIMMVIAGAHSLVALFHQYVIKDGLLLRMMRPR